MHKTLLSLAATLCAALAIGTSATAQTVSVSKLQSQSSRTVRGAQCDAMEDNKVSISVELDVPAAAVASKYPKLYNAITAYMAKAAGVSANALKSKAALDGAVKTCCNAKSRPYEEVVRISKLYEDATYITFSIWHYRMACDNAHGISIDAGVTFRKSDGSQLTWRDFGQTESLRKTVTRNLLYSDEGVETSVGDVSFDMEYSDECRLSDGTYALPLPEAAPYLTRRGWCFSYQPYETVVGGYGSMWSYVRNVEPISWNF